MSERIIRFIFKLVLAPSSVLLKSVNFLLRIAPLSALVNAVDFLSRYIGDASDEWRSDCNPVNRDRALAGNQADVSTTVSEEQIDALDLVRVLNEPRWERWFLVLFLVGQIVTLAFVAQDSKKSLGTLPIDWQFWGFLLLILGVVSISAAFTIFMWRDWFRERDRLREARRRLSMMLSFAPKFAENAELNGLKRHYRHEKSTSIIAAILGGAGLVALSAWAHAQSRFKGDWWDKSGLLIFFAFISYWVSCWIIFETCGLYLKNLKSGVRNRQLLEVFVRKRIPFTLYLRDFARECDIRDCLPLLDDVPEGKIGKREESILNEIAKLTPVFCFANYRDANLSPVAARINFIGTAWHESFVRFARKAILIVLSTDRISPGLEHELDWLETNSAWSKSFLILNEEMTDQLRAKYTRFTTTAKYIAVADSGGQITLPVELRAYLNKLADGRRQNRAQSPA